MEYAILAGLSHEPRSGYDLTKWLALVASHFWPVGHSSIYPALAALESEGLIAHETVPSEQGPERKVYALTVQGHDELLAWVDGPPPMAQTRDEQLVRALCYGFLPEERALARLTEIRRDHAARLSHYEELEHKVRNGETLDCEGRDSMDAARIGTLLVIRRGILNEQSYVQWCDEAMALIDATQPSPVARSHERQEP